MKLIKLAIISTHPIQYNAPLFRLLTERGKVQPKVFYTWSQSAQGEHFDPGFGKKFGWDIPLLDGYEYRFVENISANPGTHHFKGVVNPSLIAEIKEWGAEAILIYGWSFQSHLKCLWYFKGKIPVLFRGDSTLLDSLGGTKKLFRKVLLSFVYQWIDYALFVGQENRRYFVEFGLNHDQLIEAPHAVDNRRFMEPNLEYEREAKNWRKELGYSDKDIVVLFVGKFEPKKNPNLILALAKLLKGTEFKFLFIGNGILEQELKVSAQQDARIKFIDFQNQRQMPVVYRVGDLLILPSQGPGETWGLVMNEAMASGRAVFGSDKCGGSIDLLSAESWNTIFRSNDVSDLLVKLNQVGLDKENLRALGTSAKDRIRNWSFERICLAIEQVLMKSAS